MLTSHPAPPALLRLLSQVAVFKREVNFSKHELEAARLAGTPISEEDIGEWGAGPCE